MSYFNALKRVNSRLRELILELKSGNITTENYTEGYAIYQDYDYFYEGYTLLEGFDEVCIDDNINESEYIKIALEYRVHSKLRIEWMNAGGCYKDKLDDNYKHETEAKPIANHSFDSIFSKKL